MELMEEKQLDGRQLFSSEQETEAPPLPATSGSHVYSLCTNDLELKVRTRQKINL